MNYYCKESSAASEGMEILILFKISKVNTGVLSSVPYTHIKQNVGVIHITRNMGHFAPALVVSG